MRIYCYPANAGSTYIPLLFVGTQDRYEPVYRQQGGLRDAIADLDAGRPAIVHVHWEEFVLDGCRTEAQADEAARVFMADIGRIRARAGILFWTVHNGLPHEIPFHRQFLAIRGALAQHADVILLHDKAAIAILEGQVALDRSRIRVLPHPSYLDQFEDAAMLRAGLDVLPDRRVQGFGWIRLQKGFGEMIAMLPEAFLAKRKLRIRISGDGPEAPAVIAQAGARGDIEWDVRHVPDAETPQLLRSAACVVLPYQRALTSGVALLAMSVGALIVAVDIPPLRELLPVVGHRFLYPAGDGVALRHVIDQVLDLSASERWALIEANLAVARSLHPRIVSARLADMYDAALRTFLG